MYAQVEKPKENKSRAVVNSVIQKKSYMNRSFGFVNNRIENSCSYFEDNRLFSEQSVLQKVHSRLGVIQRQEPFDQEGKQQWDHVVEKIITEVEREYFLSLSVEEVEEYLENVAGIENPRGPYYELDNDEELSSYRSDLLSIDPEDVAEYHHGIDSELDEQYESSDDNDVEELHFSSEDDEVPANHEEFDKTLLVIRELNRLLNEHLGNLPTINKFDEKAKEIIAEIERHKEEHKNKPFPKNGFNKVELKSIKDFMPFAQSINKAKSTDKTKPTSFNYDFEIWPGARYREIMFRGKQLKDPKGQPGRSWSHIAISLHKLAYKLGYALAGAVVNANQRQVTGNQALAQVMLLVITGRGNEVKDKLTAFKVNPLLVENLEAIILEFFTLTLGVETIRLPFAQLDTILHLSHIARGRGFGPEDKTYDFLNTFSSVRQFPEGHKRVFIKGEYEKRTNKKTGKEEIVKELTQYGGFSVHSFDENESEMAGGEKVSAKSAGKSGYTQSAAHSKTEKLLAGDEAVSVELYQQVKPLKRPRRRTVHAKRLKVMGPLRMYNLFAGILNRKPQISEQLSAQKIAKFIFNAYQHFSEGEILIPNNPFSDVMFNDIPNFFDPKKPLVTAKEHESGSLAVAGVSEDEWIK